MKELEEEYYEDIEFNDLKFSPLELVQKSFYDCIFKNCDLSDCNLHETLFSNCELIQCNLSITKFDNTKLQNISFEECKLVGLDFTIVNKLILKLKFEKSIITDCNFSIIELTETEFTECKVLNCDFYKADLSKAKFINSELTGSIFEQTKLIETDFSNAFGYRINPISNNIKGLKVNMPEAVSLIEELGVEVT